jgi:uncharacterized protein (TIGR02391 family)
MPRKQEKPSVPPRTPPERAVELLKRQIARIDDVIGRHYNDPEVDRWENTTIANLNDAFGLPGGEPHPNTWDFKTAHAGPLHVNMSEYELQSNHVRLLERRKALLEGYVEQLQDQVTRPSSAAVHVSYEFHPAIERVSGRLLQDGHYKAAALEAYIFVINAVKARSGLDQDGDSLMNHAFGCDGRDPALRFNDLNSEAERDEQRGIMYLFKGIVGLRNSKAHSNAVFNSPERAHEYLALASLLLRLLEMAQAPAANV